MRDPHSAARPVGGCLLVASWLGIALQCATPQPAPQARPVAAIAGPELLSRSRADPKRVRPLTLNIASDDGCYHYRRDRHTGLTTLTLTNLRYPQDKGPLVGIELTGGEGSSLDEKSQAASTPTLEIQTQATNDYLEIDLVMTTTGHRHVTGFFNERCP